MKIEILFPEICNLFGDRANVEYLKLCLPNSEFINTPLTQKPTFMSEKVDLVYMCSTTERFQEEIIKNLSSYKNEFKNAIENNTCFLFTGNAVEILGEYIENEQGKRYNALNIFDFHVKQNFTQRHNSECEAKFGDMTVLGFKTQFTMCYPDSDENYLFDVIKGIGMNLESKKEGIHYKNFYATYLVGPLLILNPDFTKHILKTIGASENIAFEEDMYKAFEKRKRDFDKNVKVEVEKYKYI